MYETLKTRLIEYIQYTINAETPNQLLVKEIPELNKNFSQCLRSIPGSRGANLTKYSGTIANLETRQCHRAKNQKL